MKLIDENVVYDINPYLFLRHNWLYYNRYTTMPNYIYVMDKLCMYKER